MRKVLITAPFDHAQLTRLREVADVVYRPWTDRQHPHTSEELAALVRESAPDVLVVEIDPVTAEVLDAGEISVVAVCRSGIPNVDLDAAAAHDVRVLRAPGRNVQAVAEYVLSTIISALRNIPASASYITDGEWDGSERTYLRFRGDELAGQTVALHGFGAVGRRFAELLAPFGCTLLVVDPYLDQADLPAGARLVEAEEAYASADVVSLHLPVTPETRGLVAADLIGRMQAHALLVNSARSAVVDTDALLEALTSGAIRGAVLDVHDQEPVQGRDLELCRHPSVLATPHIAGATHQVVTHHSRIVADALLQLHEGQALAPELVAR